MTVGEHTMKPAEASPDDLLFIDEVAEMLRRTPDSVRAMIHEGNAPRSAKIGRRRMFRRGDVLAWIDAQFDKASA